MSIIFSHFKIKVILAYIVGIILFIVVAVNVLGNEDYIQLAQVISYFHILISLLITFLLSAMNGYVIAYLVWQQCQTSIRFVDMMMLPFMMNLCSYFIPFRGSLLFSAFFLKLKYGVEGTEGIAIGVYTLFINLMISGLVGVYYAYVNQMFFSIWTILCLLFIFSPALVRIIELLLDHATFFPHSILNNLKTMIIRISYHSRMLLLDYKTSIVMFLFTVANIIVFIFLLLWITFVLHIDSGLDKIVMFTLMMRLSTLVRLVPGNLGVQELFSGGAYYMIGGDLNDGLAIALFVRFLSLLLTFTIGTLGIAVNLHHFKMGELKKMWTESTQSKPS